MTAWSYSSISTFKQCPKKYYHLKVAKDVKEKPSEAMRYGNALHKAAELFIKDGTPLGKFSFMQRTMDSLLRIKGEPHCELRLGVAKEEDEYTPTTFYGKDVWWRGIVDLIIINGEKGFMVDYKSGKSAKYADTKQLDLMAGAAFVNYPELKEIKSALAFVVADDIIVKTHTAPKRSDYMAVFDGELDRLEGAHESGVWNAVPTPLCGWCPVKSCEHWQERR